MIYTAKQCEFLRLIVDEQLSRINLLQGAVRSGKTWISLVGWAFWVATMPKDAEYLMCAKSLTTLKRNCLEPLRKLLGDINFSYSIPAKEGWLFGRRMYLEGANDARSEGKIRGMTLQGAYCDELTLFPEEFFSMLLSRLSMPKARLMATTNPDSPMHWLKVGYIDCAAEMNMLNMFFGIDDNTFLDPEYVAALKKEYNGVFYDRYILGKWVKAEGLIYPFFDDSCQTDEVIPPNMPGWEYYVSCDYGTLNPCAMLLWAVNNREHKAILLDEYYYSGRDGQYAQKTDSEYYDALVNLVDGYNVQSVVIDPSAASFIAEIRKHGRYAVRKAKNDVVEGIRRTGAYLKDHKIMISRSCTNTIREFGLYAWDEKSNNDKPIKEHDHAMDAVRYLVYTILRLLGW